MTEPIHDMPARLAEVAAIAVHLQADTQVPAQETIAQWAIESSWGTKPVGQHNYFGMKRASRHKKWVTVTTREVIAGKSVMQNLEFADYDSLEDSCRDFCWLISHGDPYHAAWQQYQRDHDVTKLIAGISHVYATDPAYARLVTGIAFQNNVTAAIAAAKGLGER